MISDPRLMRGKPLAMAATVVFAVSLSGCALFDDDPNFGDSPYATQVQLSDATPTVASHAGVSAYDIGKVHFRGRRYGLALDSFRRELRYDARSLATLNAVAATYDMIGRTDLAERYYADALALDPDSTQTLNNMGFSQLMRGREKRSMTHLVEAERLFRLAKAHDGANPTVDANLAFLADIRGDLFGVPKNLAQVPHQKLTIVAKTPDPYAAWVERKSGNVYYLTTSPPPDMASKLRQLRLDPVIAGYAALASTPATPDADLRKVSGHQSANLPRAVPIITARPINGHPVAAPPRLRPTPVRRKTSEYAAVALPRSKPVPTQHRTSEYAAVTVPKSKPRQAEQPAVHLASLIRPRPKPPVNGSLQPAALAPLSGPGEAQSALDGRSSILSPVRVEPQSAPRIARETQIVVGSPDRWHRVIIAGQTPRAAPLIASVEGW